jgi:hypothetical protein
MYSNCMSYTVAMLHATAAAAAGRPHPVAWSTPVHWTARTCAWPGSGRGPAGTHAACSSTGSKPANHSYSSRVPGRRAPALKPNSKVLSMLLPDICGHKMTDTTREPAVTNLLEGTSELLTALNKHSSCCCWHWSVLLPAGTHTLSGSMCW